MLGGKEMDWHSKRNRSSLELRMAYNVSIHVSYEILTCVFPRPWSLKIHCYHKSFAPLSPHSQPFDILNRFVTIIIEFPNERNICTLVKAPELG